MKKIFYFICALALTTFVQSCDPMDDVYAELDNGAIDQSGIKEVILELTKAEYDRLKGVANAGTPYTNQYFHNEDSAKVIIPVILAKKYPYLGEKATAKVTYDFGNKNLAVTAPILYTADDATYVAGTGDVKFKNFNSEAQIIAGVKYLHPNPKQGDLIRITYFWNPTKTNVTSDVVYLNGAWNVAYTLVAADYTNMLQSFPNFSSVDAARQYVPKYLEIKFPFKNTEGQVQTVIYDWSRTVNTVRVTTQELLVLKYSNGAWVLQNGTDKVTMQFAITKGVWLADNTIKYTVTTDEHKVEVSKYVENAAAKASIVQYGNFDLKLFTSRDDIVSALSSFTKAKFPTAGVGQRYLLTYRTHNPSGTATLWLELGEDGNYKEKED